MLVYENLYKASDKEKFIQKVKDISFDLKINPNWLMALMAFETARTFSPSIKNPYFDAYGLIQFTNIAIMDINRVFGEKLTLLEIPKMDSVTQLDYVKKYLEVQKKNTGSNFSSYIDLYMAVFFPKAIGKPDDWILQTSGISAATIAKQNPVFSQGKNYITVSDVKREYDKFHDSKSLEIIKKKIYGTSIIKRY